MCRYNEQRRFVQFLGNGYLNIEFKLQKHSKLITYCSELRLSVIDSFLRIASDRANYIHYIASHRYQTQFTHNSIHIHGNIPLVGNWVVTYITFSSNKRKKRKITTTKITYSHYIAIDHLTDCVCTMCSAVRDVMRKEEKCACVCFFSSLLSFNFLFLQCLYRFILTNWISHKTNSSTISKETRDSNWILFKLWTIFFFFFFFFSMNF